MVEICPNIHDQRFEKVENRKTIRGFLVPTQAVSLKAKNFGMSLKVASINFLANKVACFSCVKSTKNRASKFVMRCRSLHRIYGCCCIESG